MFIDMFRRKIGYIEIVLFFLSAIASGVLLQVLSPIGWLFLVLIPTVLLGWHYYEQIGPNWRALLMGTYFGIILQSILRIIHIISDGFINPPQWDFVTIWMDGRIARQGLNFYLPSNYLNYPMPVKTGQDFAAEFLKVGFGFPPPTILMFYPLGWFDNISIAYLFWQMLMVASIVISIFLLWKLFLDRNNKLGLLVSGALVFLLPATYSTLIYAQTNYIVVLAMLLYISYSEYYSGGIWISLGFLVKPYVGMIFLFAAIRRQWRTLIGSIVSYVFLSISTLLLIGFTTFAGYITQRPVSKLPDSVYTESVNQSLLAQILRFSHYDFSGRSPLINPVFILLAIILLTITCVLTFSIKKEDSIWTLVLTILTALLIYPGTLTHYSVILIIPAFVLWNNRINLPFGLLISTLVITATYLFILKDRNYIFIAIALNWFVFAVIGSWKVVGRSGEYRRTSQISKVL